MATDASRRNAGLGGELLEAGLARVAARGGTLVWCNARLAAAVFYGRHGFTARGDVFDIPTVGPHVVLARRLTT
jgi:predicted GNAT family N-acyltransferase